MSRTNKTHSRVEVTEDIQLIQKIELLEEIEHR